jgi:hypothetical protein
VTAAFATDEPVAFEAALSPLLALEAEGVPRLVARDADGDEMSGHALEIRTPARLVVPRTGDAPSNE